MIDNPWKDIPRTPSHGDLCAHRVDPKLPWGFFWGRGFNNSLLFILQHDGPEIGRDRIPSLRGVEILDKPDGDSDHRLLVLRLESIENRDIFAYLCRDIIAVACTAREQKHAVDMALQRTWRWHHLLRDGASRKLSREQQKGLIAEILFLQETAAPIVGLSAAINAWQGPFGSPKDFEFGATCVEVKSKRAAGSGKVKISSADQLDTTKINCLFLHVRDVDDVEPGVTGALTLNQVVDTLQSDCEINAPEAVMKLEAALLAAGFTSDEDYEKDSWLAGTIYEYRVEDNFPRLVPSGIPSGVSSITYVVDINQCNQFAVRIGEIGKTIEESM